MAGAAARRQRNLVVAAALGVFTLGTLSLPLLLRYCLPPHPRLSLPLLVSRLAYPPSSALSPSLSCLRPVASHSFPRHRSFQDSKLAESHVPIPLLSPLSSAFRLPHVLDFLPFPPPYSPLSLSCLLGSSSAFTRAAAGEGGGHLNPQAGYRESRFPWRIQALFPLHCPLLPFPLAFFPASSTRSPCPGGEGRLRFHSQPLVEREGALSPQAVQRGPYLNAGSKDIGRDPTPIHVYKHKRESQADQ
ncbi:unnamed protein product [Closterium sp. NIES-64]|nr:unnamed protein product [Closterium sp. NIES-64]